MAAHRPRMSPERAEQLRRWHEDASAELRERGEGDVEYLGLRLYVPATVFPLAPANRRTWSPRSTSRGADVSLRRSSKAAQRRSCGLGEEMPGNAEIESPPTHAWRTPRRRAQGA